VIVQAEGLFSSRFLQVSTPGVHLHQHPSHHLHHASTLRAHWAGKNVSLHPLSLFGGFTSKHSHCL